MKGYIKVWAIALIIIILLTVIYFSTRKENDGEDTLPPYSSPYDIDVVLTIEREEYQESEPINVRVLIKNVGSTDLEIREPDYFYSVRLKLITSNGTSFRPWTSYNCQKNRDNVSLKKGDSLSWFPYAQEDDEININGLSPMCEWSEFGNGLPVGTYSLVAIYYNYETWDYEDFPNQTYTSNRVTFSII